MKLPVKYKGVIYLTLLVIVLPWAMWSLALKDTIYKHQGYRKDAAELARLRSLGNKAGDPREVDPFTADGRELVASGEFINAIAMEAQGSKLAIDKYIPHLTHESNGIKVMTAELVVSGGYVPIVSLLDFIERELASCMIISADFRSTKERRTGDIKLSATILVQQIKKL